MGHRTRKHRASRAVDAEGKPLITALPATSRQEPVTMAALKAYAPPPGRARGPVAQMLRSTKGARKWLNGLPSIHYSRDGYEWVKGVYIAMPGATGITHKYQSNRASLRGQSAASGHPTEGLSARALAKRRARAVFAERKMVEPQRVAQFEHARKRARLAGRHG